MKSRTIYDEVQQLKDTLALKDLADVIGCRRETLSRLKPPRRPTREIERRIDDVFAVVEKARLHQLATPGGVRHLLLARRVELAHRSMAEMIRNNCTDAVLALIDAPPAPGLDQELAALSVELDAWPLDSGGSGSFGATPPPVALDDELQRVIDEVISRASEYLGPLAVSVASVGDHTADADDADTLLVELEADLDFADADARFRAFLADHLSLLHPVADRMTVTVAGA